MPTIFPKTKGRTGKVHLQGLGAVDAVRADQLQATMVRLYNYGGTGVINDVVIEGGWVHYTVTEADKTFKKRSRVNTLIPLSLGSWYLYQCNQTDKTAKVIKDRAREELAKIRVEGVVMANLLRVECLEALIASKSEDTAALGKEMGLYAGEEVDL